MSAARKGDTSRTLRGASVDASRQTVNTRGLIAYIIPGSVQHYRQLSRLAQALPHVTIRAVSGPLNAEERVECDSILALPNVDIVTLPLDLGKGAALRAGLNSFFCEYVALVDLDGSVSIDSVRQAFEVLERDQSLDCVVADRYHRQSRVQLEFSRLVCSRLFSAIVRSIFSLRVRDPQSPLKVFRRASLLTVFEGLRLYNSGFDVELLFTAERAGLRIREIPFQWSSLRREWSIVPTATHVGLALLGHRLLCSPLGNIPLLSLLFRHYSLPVKRAYRIMIFCWRDPGHPQAGGSEEYLFEQARRWAASGHSVTWFSQSFAGANNHERKDGIEYVRLGGFPWVFPLAFAWYVFRSSRNYDFIIDCMNGIPFFTPLFSTKPKVCLVHHVHTHHFKEELPLLVGLLASLVETRIAPMFYRGTPFITVSESTKSELAEHRMSALPIGVIHNGVPETFVPGRKAKNPTVLYLGRLKKYKRVEKLIDAFSAVQEQVPGVQLQIAGTGDHEDELKAYVASRGIENVQFLGRVDDATKMRLMQEAWVFGMPSSIEGWGIVVIEANACGTPALAYDVPGLRDCIQNGRTGLLAENDREYASLLLQVLTRDDDRAALSQAAHSWSRNFSWEATAARTLEYIRNAQPWQAVFEPGDHSDLVLRVPKVVVPEGMSA